MPPRIREEWISWQLISGRGIHGAGLALSHARPFVPEGSEHPVWPAQGVDASNPSASLNACGPMIGQLDGP